MIKLLFAHICENVFISEGSKSLNIIGIFENIGAQNFPAVHPKFAVVTAIQGDIGNYQQALIITSQQTGQEISRLVGQSNIISQNGKAIFMGNFIMLTFPLRGKYLINVLINNNKIGDMEFNVG